MLGTYAMIDALGRVYTNKDGFIDIQREPFKKMASLIVGMKFVQGFHMKHSMLVVENGIGRCQQGWLCEQIHRD